MKRRKKIVLIAHCLLNVNSKVFGLAPYSGSFIPLIDLIIRKGYGIIQLPCPEIGYCGVRRWGQTIEQMDVPAYRRHCVQLLLPIVDQVLDYLNNGYKISCVIGIDYSPSCGVCKTCKSDQYFGEISTIKSIEEVKNSLKIVDGQGILIQELEDLFMKSDIKVPYFGIIEDSINFPPDLLDFFTKEE